MILFGVELASLYLAIAQVESECGRTSPNVYQIQPVYIDDVNEILRNVPGRYPIRYRYLDINNADKMTGAMFVYWTHWGCRYIRETGKRPTAEVFARIHNGGPFGWKKSATLPYWEKVKKSMAAQQPESGEMWLDLVSKKNQKKEIKK